MGSPVLPSDVDAAVPSVFSNICAGFKSLFLLGPLIKTFWHWAFTSTGAATEDFKSLFVSIGVPTGGMIFWPVAGFTPDGFLVANGQIVPIALYPALHERLGTTFGGDGTTTFGLPNLTDRYPCGASGAVAPGSTFGDSTVKLKETNNGPHTHQAIAAAQGPNAANIIWGSDPGNAKVGKIYPNDHGLFTGVGTGEVPIATTLEESGDGTPFSILPPSFAGNWLIKT